MFKINRATISVIERISKFLMHQKPKQHYIQTKSAGYWEEVIATWQSDKSQALWRAHSNAVNIMLLQQWLPKDKVERSLKTDLFDELYNAGLLPNMSSYSRDVIGIDISFTAARSTREKNNVTITADTRRLPFTECVFDIIVSNSTLDHFDTTDEIILSLQEFKRVLKPGGQLILTLDNPINPIIALRNRLPNRLLYGTNIAPYYVGKTLGPKQIKKSLAQIDFKIDEIKAILHCPRFFAIEVSKVFQKYSPSLSQKKFLDILLAFERIANWPTRFLTGHFIAVKASKRPEK